MVNELWGDIRIVIGAVLVICVYLTLNLGSCSPLHCRIVLAVCGIICVLVAVASGYSICFVNGWKLSEIT